MTGHVKLFIKAVAVQTKPFSAENSFCKSLGTCIVSEHVRGNLLTSLGLFLCLKRNNCLMFYQMGKFIKKMNTHAEHIRMQIAICAGPERGTSIYSNPDCSLDPTLPLYFTLSNQLVKYKTNPGSKDWA